MQPDLWFMLKKGYIFLLAALMLVLTAPATAQVTHYLGAWAQGGEYSFLATVDKTAFPLKSSLGGGGGIGFTYELRAGKHFLFDVGVGANSAWTRFKVPDAQYTLHNMIDSEGEVFDYIYSVNRRRDAYHTTSVQVPLMVGGQWGRFYFLVGAKFDMSLLTRTTSKALISTLGDYAPYIEPLHNIPAQGFVDNMPWIQQSLVTFLPNVTASWEIGVRLGEIYKETGFDVPSQKIQYRIALFADHGILDPHVATQNLLMHVPATYNPANPLNGLVASDVMAAKELTDIMGRFNTFMIGVKFTVLFRTPERKHCVICHDEKPFRSTHGLIE